jgi:very-short-patch-repair endonuclease
MTNNLNRAKDLRQTQTEAETFVWSELRSRRFSGFKFRRQVPLGNYIVDFVCLDRRVIVELDGGQHNEVARKAYDARRDAWLRGSGFVVLRFWNSDVFLDWEAMAERIRHTLQGRPSKQGAAAPSPPAPLPQWGEGGRERLIARSAVAPLAGNCGWCHPLS